MGVLLYSGGVLRSALVPAGWSRASTVDHQQLPAVTDKKRAHAVAVAGLRGLAQEYNANREPSTPCYSPHGNSIDGHAPQHAA